TMADQRTMAQMLQAPTEGYEDAIVVPAITADNFELKHGLLTLVQNKQFFGHDKEDPHAHVRYFNKITSTLNLFDESFSEARDRFKDLLRACPHRGFLELHQLDTFYNALNSKDHDLLNSAVGDMVKALLLDKKGQNQSPAPEKAVEESYVTCGGAHSYHNCPAIDGNVYRDNIQQFISQASAVNYNQGNTSYRPPMMSNQIRPPGSPLVVQSESLILNSEHVTSPIFEPVIAPVSTQKHNPKSLIPYPSRINDERNREKANNQIENFYQICKYMRFKISFADALILMPKFTSTLRALIGNKEKLSEMARTLLNEHCSVVLLNKLPGKLGDPGKFLIPCDFPGMAECLALEDLDVSINLMPFSVWKRLYVSDLTPTCMTPELADRSISHPVGVAEDVYVKVGSFHFPTDFVVVDFDADPRVPLILGRSFLKTG
nr:reverse transcriptase domain-containing protein [Tanacetum cinerariifolium]